MMAGSEEKRTVFEGVSLAEKVAIRPITNSVTMSTLIPNMAEREHTAGVLGSVARVAPGVTGPLSVPILLVPLPNAFKRPINPPGVLGVGAFGSDGLTAGAPQLPKSSGDDGIGILGVACETDSFLARREK